MSRPQSREVGRFPLLAAANRSEGIVRIARLAQSKLPSLAAVLLAVFAPAVSFAQNGAESANTSQVKRGEYLARAGDCIACHTAPTGRLFAGGFAMPTPFGTLYSTNITPDPETGIGKW